MKHSLLTLLRPRPEYGGYSVPGTLDQNPNPPELKIRAAPCHPTDLLDSQGDLPHRLSLQVILKGVPISRKEPPVTLIKDGTTYQSCPLYDPQTYQKPYNKLALNCLYKSVHLIFSGTLSQSKQGAHGLPLSEGVILQLKPGDLLYEKKFHIQTKPVLQRVRSVYRDAFTTPSGAHSGAMDLFPLYGFGGYFIQGQSLLEDIAQTYFSIEQFKQQTLIKLQTYEYWRKAGCPPPYGGLYAKKYTIKFIDIRTIDQVSSLASDILLGKLKVNLSYRGHSHTYSSCAYNQKDPSTSMVTLIFKRKD